LSDPVVGAVDLVKKFNTSNPVEVRIDAPRMPLDKKRQWYWDGKKRRWKPSNTQSGYGRHCEIVISAHRIANPQWTPVVDVAPEWMRLGFNLYSALNGTCQVHEVFPTASYNLLYGVCDVRLNVDFFRLST
jgi:hypothetical protein